MAGECLRFARTAVDPTNKALLLDMAHVWVSPGQASARPCPNHPWDICRLCTQWDRNQSGFGFGSPHHSNGAIAPSLRMAPPNLIKGAYTRRRTQGSMLQLSSSLGRALPSAKRAPFPSFITPCLATLRGSVPNGGSYLHELKFDRYRIQAHLREGRVTLYTRSGFDWTKRFATIAADVARQPGERPSA
jgi:hypothetical protein